MRFIVWWSPESEEHLATTWLHSDDRNAVTAASHRLDRALAENPYECGFHRGVPTDRTAIDLPLGIDFEIIEDDKKVRVLRVWSLD